MGALQNVEKLSPVFSPFSPSSPCLDCLGRNIYFYIKKVFAELIGKVIESLPQTQMFKSLSLQPDGISNLVY